MADENEKKIEALKKAYAEIILNSSKEAAARIMMADHKARRFEQQLVFLKEESLSMLLRLKEQFNTMVLESEAKSLKQQMKIDELEAQLNEAEGIIIDLRSELNQVQDQLEFERRQNRKKASNEHLTVTNNPIQDNVPNSSFICQVQDSKSKLIDLNPRLIENKFLENMDSTNVPVESHLDQFDTPNDDFSSIIMQNRENDLFKKGCTQRIRAFEANLTNVRSTTPSKDNKCLSHVYSSPEHSSETDKSKVKVIQYGWLKQPRSSCKNRAIRSRKSAWKNAKYTSLNSCCKNFEKPQPKPFISPLKRCYNVVNVETVDIPIGLIELDPKKHTFCHVPKSDSNFNSENYGACSSSDQFHGDCDLLDSKLVDVPILDGYGSSHSELSRSEKALKFTFQRKRWKNVLGKIDDNISCDGVPVKRMKNLADVPMVGKYGDCEEMNQVAHELSVEGHEY